MLINYSTTNHCIPIGETSYEIFMDKIVLVVNGSTNFFLVEISLFCSGRDEHGKENSLAVQNFRNWS